MTKAGTSSGSGLGATPPTTIPPTSSVGQTFETRNLTSGQLWGWLNTPPASVPAVPPASGTATVGSTDYMRALLGADFWDDFASRNGVSSGYRVPPNVANQAFTEAGSPYRYPTLPQSTVGGSGAQVINTTGTVKAATDNTKAVVTPARIAGSGLSAISGSTVALSALTFGGALCGTLNGLGALFGDPFKSYDGPAETITTPGQPGSCAGIAYATSIDRCMTVSWATPTDTSTYTIGPRNWQANNGNATYSNAVRLPSGATANSLGLPTAATTAVIVIPCASPENACGFIPYHLNPLPAPGGGDGIAGTYLTRIWSTSVYGKGLLWPELQEKGYRRRLATQVWCKRPEDSHEMNLRNYSEPFYDSEAAPDWPATTCPNGYAPTAVVLTRQKANGGGTSAATWSLDSTVLDWALGTPVRDNPVTLKCLTVGALGCPKHDLSPGNPEGNEAIGGVGGVSVPKGAPSSDAVVDEVIDSLDLPEAPPEIVDTDGDGVPDDEDETPSGPAPGPSGGQSGPPGDAGSSGPDDPELDANSNCVPSGWGWLNPVEWVLKPVKCALMWAFWDQESADEMGDLWGDTGGPWADAATGTAEGLSFEPDAGEVCIPLDPEEICTSHVLSIELPAGVSLFITAVFTVALVFEVVGLFARITGG